MKLNAYPDASGFVAPSSVSLRRRVTTPQSPPQVTPRRRQPDKHLKLLNNQSGQFLVEGILLMVVFLGIAMFTANFFKKNDLIKNLIKAPWTSLAGMLQNGEWQSVQASSPLHPTAAFRHVTIEGTKP